MSEMADIELSFVTIEYFRKALNGFLQCILKTKLKIKGVLLFGSVATGKARYELDHESDIDLIIICDDLHKDRQERNKIILELTDSVNYSIQSLWWTSEELERHVKSKFYLVLDAFDEGIILYDPEKFLQNIRHKLFEDLKAKGVIKTELYWQWPMKNFGDKIEY